MRVFAMKTLVLAVAALFVSAGTAMAQQTEAFISQVGDDHVASAEQVDGVGNFAIIEQSGTAAHLFEGVAYEATVEQSGEGNESTITQGSGDGNMLATATQVGNDNVATQTQRVSGNDQGLRDGIATIQQLGSRNDATQHQVHSGAATSPASISHILQDGSDNFAFTDQGGSGGVFSSVISQLGDWNEAEVSQSGFTHPGGFLSEILQDGSNNSAVVTQSN